MGLEVELVQALADAMNLKVRFVEIPFAGLIPALERGEIDVAFAGMTITPERNARVAFAGPYFISGNNAAGAQARAGRHRGPRAARRSQAVLRGARRLEPARASSAPTCRRRSWFTVSSNDAVVKALLAGEVDGMISDLQVCNGRALAHPRSRAPHALPAVHGPSRSASPCPPTPFSFSIW